MVSIREYPYPMAADCLQLHVWVVNSADSLLIVTGSLFGTLEVAAPRFKPCRCCCIASQRTIAPVAEIMPDRCTFEYEHVLAELEAWLPYRRGRFGFWPTSSGSAMMRLE
jgi:hypothetical protein